ncbi:uncharacterized protein LOC120109806 [Phoenix dactylifera]|uniref:Uncharacterized protein LOC120109806 n=1 Tax=Phoenix dactylifera TaxID=42345 RepID=A0A8B8ZYK6_PHODC|nr:uncharacterized protein LOC120109806 [Phoenix dactylifera]
MPTSNTSLFSRLKKREAEAGGAIPKPRKKAKSAAPSAPAEHIHEIDTLVFIASECQEESRRLYGQLESAKKKVAELEAALAEAEARREATEAERLALADVLEEERAAHTLARSKLRASEARLAEARSEAAGHKYEGGVLCLKVEQLEVREKRALERAENAVELFKESEEFRDMLEEETVDGFLWGFENFRRQMAWYCPQLDLSGIRPRMGLSDEVEAEVPAIIAAEEALAEAEGGMAEGELAETEAGTADRATSEAPFEEVVEEVPGATDEAPIEVAEGGLGPAPAEDPQIIAIDDLEGDTGAAAGP